MNCRIKARLAEAQSPLTLLIFFNLFNRLGFSGPLPVVMTDAFEEEAEPTVSIGEYLKDVEEQELEADLVLGGDEGKECTYSNGYMKRQAIFSCLTCTPDGNAGVCTACSLSCHDGHEVVELWTKRNFRCDCGNSKFGEFICKLLASKDVENPQNSYNHNFRGLYCACGRPYPDPEAEEQVEMIQCCVCEDWFHEEHLGLESSDMIPRDEEGEPVYEDFVCQGCANVCSFVMLYPPTIFASAPLKNAANSMKDKEVAENVPLSSEETNSASSSKATNNASSSKETNNANSSEETLVANVSKGELLPGKGTSEENNTSLNHCNGVIDPSQKCVLGLNLSEAVAKLEKIKPIFLCRNWREVLCRCQNCTDFYNQKAVGFLLDKEDTIAEYETMAKQKREELDQQQSAEFLNKLGHIEKIEILTGIADIKNELHSYLESFDPSKPVTSADIHQVFENLAKKRKRME